MTGTSTTRRTASIGVHRVEQDLAGAPVDGLTHPLERVEARGRPPAVRRDAEPGRLPGLAPGVQTEDDDLVAEPGGDLVDGLRPRDGAGVDADLVRAGAQEQVDVVDAADAPAHRERDEDRLGRAPHHVVGRGAPLRGGGDVEEDEFVGALASVGGGQVDGIPRVAEVAEVDPLDDPSVVDVEARDDPDRDRHARHRRTRTDKTPPHRGRWAGPPPACLPCCADGRS